MRTDKEIAQDFFDMLRRNGFKAVDNFTSYDLTSNPGSVVFQLYDYTDNVFCEFDFLEDKFYRIAGQTTAGYMDEVDCKKYNGD